MSPARSLLVNKRNCFSPELLRKKKKIKKIASSPCLSVESQSEDSKKESVEIIIQLAKTRQQRSRTDETCRNISDLDKDCSAFLNCESSIILFLLPTGIKIKYIL